MLHFTSALILCAFFCSRALAAPMTFECPLEIKTTQSLTGEAPKGWVGSLENRYPQTLRGVSVFDGPPQDHADLVPDDESPQASTKPAVWTFYKDKERSIWLGCAYSGTTFIMAKELPRSLTRCQTLQSKTRPPSDLGLICQ